MSFNVYTTDFFDKELKKLSKKHPSVKNDYIALVDSLKEKPKQGQALGKDCYKIRMAISSKGKGKSGGSRVITCIKIVADAVFLLSIYDKGDKESASDKELDKLLKAAGLL
ncbi:MAG: type II toxin-antitoxin system RelE/ParE family toxin [Candidatus Cloacimonetes bacterium]|nr:type II toxin-antitoxin system RelE/ParE family toxin [Candidatus Cloacimonadota bacterium]